MESETDTADLMGVYQQHVERLRARKPSLANLCQFLSLPDSAHRPCRVTSLNFYEGSKTPINNELDFQGLYSTLLADSVHDLADNKVDAGYGIDERYIHQPGDLQGRILVVEDLDKRIVELFGHHLNIDPMFFAGHIHVPWAGLQAQSPDQCTLPSQSKRQNFTNIHYHRTISFDAVTPPAKKLLRRMNVDRKVVVSPISKNQYVGLAQHCTSVLLSQSKTHWLGLLLVDRPIDGEYFFATERGGSLQAIALPSSHFLGGYEDYLDSASILSEETQSSEYYNRNSTLDDMVFYWTTQHLQSFKVSNPSLNAISHYPLRIVAAEWIKYIAIMYRALKQYEYSTSVTNPRDELEKLNSDMRALQRWRRRSMSSGYKITAVIRMLKANSTFLCSDGDSASLIEDFEYVFAMVEDFGRRLESMLPVVTSLVQIVDSRRSFDETANVSRLTVMALVFVPLAYVSSLFSMNEKLAPGGPRFWVYFVVAIPVTIAVILVAKPPFGMIRRTIRRVRWIRKRKAPDEDRNELNADLSKTEV